MVAQPDPIRLGLATKLDPITLDLAKNQI